MPTVVDHLFEARLLFFFKLTATSGCLEVKTVSSRDLWYTLENVKVQTIISKLSKTCKHTSF